LETFGIDVDERDFPAVKTWNVRDIGDQGLGKSATRTEHDHLNICFGLSPRCQVSATGVTVKPSAVLILRQRATSLTRLFFEPDVDTFPTDRIVTYNHEPHSHSSFSIQKSGALHATRRKESHDYR